MDFPTRKSIRLKHWDYSNPGCYHVTMCTHDKAMLFGEVVHPNDERAFVQLSPLGQACDDAIRDIPSHFKSALVCNYVVMPNHVHLLISLQGDEAPALGRVISYLKSHVTRISRQANPDSLVWQSRYYDRIIRDNDDFERAWSYIDENPVKWGNDEYYG